MTKTQQDGSAHAVALAVAKAAVRETGVPGLSYGRELLGAEVTFYTARRAARI